MRKGRQGFRQDRQVDITMPAVWQSFLSDHIRWL